MGVYTTIAALDANDEQYLKDKADFEAGKIDKDEAYEIFEGYPADRPGKWINIKDAITHTDDEYGGWIVDLSKIPKNSTHILVTRG